MTQNCILDVYKRQAQMRAEEELRQKHSLLEYYHSKANLSRAMERLKVKSRYTM